MSKHPTKTIIFSLPSDILDDLDRVCRRTRRTRPEIVREALRHYLTTVGSRAIPVVDAEPDEIEAIRRGREDAARGETISLEELQKQLGLPTQ